MTAVDLDALDKLRGALAATLYAHLGYIVELDVYESAADALLPVVDRLANERAAAELRAAADNIRALANSPAPAINDPFDAVVILRVRAAALDPT